MNTALSNGRKVSFFIGLVLALFAFTTCDLPVGIGGQIDLGAPRVQIEAPGRNDYIKGSFTISGTADDDTGLTKVIVIIAKRSGEVLLTQEAPVANKSYSLTLDSASGAYDGEIIVTVKATDGFNKSAEQGLSIFIDNKAPTVLVTAPLTRNSGNPPQYTNSIDLKGEVYDQSPLVDVSVTLLNPDGSVLAGPQMADGTNTWTTRFNLKDELTGNPLIPGLIDETIYHYRVDVTDAAGNQNSYYFHRFDINAIKTPGTPFPSMNEIGRIDQNGTTGAVSGITAAALQAIRLSSIANYGDFKYIAAPQIEFQFTNISINGTAEENTLAPKSKITGIITPPINSGAVTKEDVKVEIYDYAENLLTTHTNTDVAGDSDYITVTSVGDSVSFAFALVNAAGVDLPPERYKLKLYAKTDNNTSGNTNFFEITIDAESPLFDETSILAGDIFRSGSFTMSFDGQHSTNLAKIEIYQAFGSNPFPGTPNETITAGFPATSFTGKLSSSLPYGASPADGLYNYRAVLSTVGGKTSVLLRSIVYDNTAPTVELTGFTKYATANKVNKTVTFSSVSSDANGINGTKYFVSTNGVTAPAYADVVGGDIVLIPGTASIDTTLLTNLATYYLWIVSVDKAGNEGHSTAQQFVVDQSTDLPELSFTSVDTAVTSEAQVAGPPVKNLLVSGGKISGTIMDDDGLPATATIYIDTNKDGDFGDAGETNALALSGTGLTKTFDYSLGALADGTYRFYIDAADTTGVHNTAMTPVWFAYDTAVPTVTFNANATDANPVGPYRNADFTVQGTVQDSNGISMVEFSFNNGGAWENLGITANPGENKTWTRAIVASSNNGAKTLLVRTTDTFGRTNTAGPIAVTIDTALPSGTINAFGGGYYADTLLALSGTASDALSGIAKVEYSLVSNTGPWTLLTGTTTWFKNDIPAGALSEGTATVWVKVSDNAGNESSPVLSTTFTVDHNAPLITVDASFNGAVYKNTQFTIFGTVSDTNLGGSPIAVTAKKDGAAHTLTGTFTYAAGSWSQDVNIAGSGNYEITITATDSVGRQSVEKRTIVVDSVDPTVELTSFNKYATANKVNKTVTFSSVSSDANGINGTKYFVSTNGVTAPAYADVVGSDIVLIPGTASIDTTLLTNLATYYLWIVSVDKAGNEGHSTAQQFVVDQSTDLPELSFTSLDTAVTSEAQVAGPPVKNLLVSGGKISGTIMDDDGLPATATIYIDTNKDGDFGDAGETNALALSGTGLTKTFDYSLGALADGTYRFYIDAADTTGVHNTAMTPVWFAYDTAVPTVTFNANATDANPVGPYRNADFTVQGTVQDSNGISMVEFSFNNGGAWENLGITANPGENKAWTRAIVAASNNGAKTLLVRTTDTFGRTNTAGPIAVTIDTALPSGTINAFGGGYYADTLLALSGTASDALSGIAKVEYSLVSNTGPWTALTGTTTWFKNDIPAGALSEGTATVWVKVSDNAGNESSPVLSTTFTVDHNAPLITVDASFNGAVYKNTQFTIFGTVSDTNLGGSPIVVTAKKDGAEHTLTGTFTYAAGSWSQDVNIAGSGNYEITITATDAVGRQSVEKRTITVDQTDPSLEITSILPQLTGAIVNGKITLSVNASDANGLDGVKYFFRSDASIPGYTDALSAPVSALMSAPYTAVIDTTNAAFTNNTTYTLWVVARDRAGNISRASSSITIQQSSDLPQGAIDSPANTEQIGADRKVRGTFQDDDGVALNGAVLYVRKQGAGGYTSKPIASSSSAGQLVAWTVDITDVLTAGGDGTYEMYLGVTDDTTRKNGLLAQTYTSTVQTFLYDVNPPTVSALTPAPSKAAYKTADVITFSWTASDTGSGISSQVADVDGASTGLGSVTSLGGNNYQIVYTVPSSGVSSGNKTLTIVVTDSVGRSSTRTYTFLIDIDNPVVDAAFTLEPGFVGSTPNGTFSVKGTASDNRGLDRVEVNFSGPDASDGTNWSLATLVNGNWTYSVNSATYVNTNGTLTFKVRAVDQAGNTSSEQTFNQTVNQAADKPLVTILSPVDASTYGTTVQLSGTATDDDNLAGVNPISADAIEVQWKPTAGSYTTVNPSISGTGKNATWNYELSGLASGGYIVRARARDANGLWGDYTSEIAFTVNAGAPSLTVSTSVAAFLNNASLTLNGTVSDPQGVQYVRVRINGGSWQNASAISGTNWNETSVTWQINLNLGSDGFKTLEIQAADGDSYATNQQISTTLDSTPPDGAFDAQFKDHPTGSFLNTTLLNKMVRITGTVTENNLADTNPVEISINGGAYAPVTGTLTWYYVWDTSALSNGDYELRLRITDKAGNVTTSIVKTVTTNQAADTPQITQAFAPAPTAGDAGLNVLSTQLKVSGTITDDDGFNTGAVSILLDGTPPSIGATNTAGTTATWEYTWGSLSQGVHYYTITVTDKNGATGVLGPTYFLVDNTNPVLTVSNPTAGAKVKEGTLAISGTASDTGGLGGTPLSIQLRHSNPSSPLHNLVYTPAVVGGNFSQNVTINTASLDGTLYIDFTLTDLAGRQATLTRAITIDTTPPVLNLTNPSPGAYINGLVSITGTADDLNGLADVTLEILDPTNLNLVKANINRSGSTLSSWEFPFNSDAYASSSYAEDISGGQGKLWKLWYKLRAVDNAGNETVIKIPPNGALDYPYYIIDLDGDKPQISMTQPKNGDTIGGFVTMFGTATDDDGPVMQVEVQIDVDGDFNFTDSMDIDGDTTVQLGSDQNIFGNIVHIGNAAHKWEDESAWYVVNVTNNSWTLELNSNGELYKTNTGGTGQIRIRVRSRDIFGTASEYIERTITLDETFPRIENITPSDQSYQSAVYNMYAEFRDNNPLVLTSNSQVRININKTGYQTLTEGPNSGAGHPYSLVANGTGFDLTFPIDTNDYYNGTSGILYVDLYVKDESNYTNQKSYTFYIDNQVPSGSWSDRSGAPDGNGVRNGQINLNGTTPVSFIEGNLSDSGAVSGISRVEVYFVKAGTVRRIKGATGQLTPANSENTSVDIYNEGTSTWSSSPENLPFVQHSDGGYGDNYVIRIDRPTEMSSIQTGADADGDGFWEFIGIDGGAQRWRAYFSSQYLPDGEIDIHYVVYDLAGNRIHKVRRGFIANNGPSVSRIRIGSDYNGNNQVVDIPGSVTEILDYYYPLNSIDRYSSNQPVKIKNGKLYFNIQSTDPNGTIASTVINIIPPSPGSRGLLTGFGAGGNVETPPLSPINIVIGSAQFPTAGDYTLEVVVKDNDNIPTRQTMVIRVLDTTDGLKPVLTPTAMTQANGVPVSGSVKQGHLELQSDNSVTSWNTIKAAYGNDNDPKVSGEINLRGTVTDTNRISSLDITGDGLGTNTVIATWDGTKLASSNGRLTIESQSLTEDGHTITFVYKWDTATVTGVAGLNKAIAFRATDANTNNSDPHTTLQYDVVPFITGIKRAPVNTYTTYRSRQGWYSLRQGEAVIVSGFNMFNAITDTITFNNTSGTTTAFALSDVNTSGRSSAGFTITALAATVSTGPVLITVNSQPSINNLNDNESFYLNALAEQVYYNSEKTVNYAYDGSTLWTDDRRVHVWRSNDAQGATNRGYFTGSADPEYPAMTIDGSGILYGSWSNYADSDILYAPNNGAASVIFHGYDPSEHTDIHFGGRATVAFNANLYGNGAWNVTGAGGTYIWDANATTTYTGTPTGGVYNAEALYHDQKLMQFTNQRIVTNGTDIHVSYYDTDTKALKYFYRSSGDNTYYTPSWINIDGGSDADDLYTVTGIPVSVVNPGFEEGTLNGWTIIQGTASAQNNNADTGTWSGRLDDNTGTTDPRIEMYLTGLMPNYSYTVTLRAKSNNNSVTVYSGVTGHGGTGGAETSRANTAYGTLTINFTTGAASTTATLYVRAVNTNGTLRYGYIDNIAITASGPQVLVTNGTRTGAAGEFSSIDLSPTNKYPVIAYYDTTRKTVRLARATAINPSPSQWVLQDVMDTADDNYVFSGKYISMKVDGNGYVHMVFYRNSTGDLIYIKSTNAITGANESNIANTYSFGSSVIIDSIGSVGVWADITFMNNQPYISYLDSSLVNTFDAIKIAFWDTTINDWEYVNAALGYEVESVRTSIETDTGTNFWQQAIGYSSSDFFRIAYYVRQ